ncbi:hypothetical protein DBR36_06220, partial [Microbacterium sp. HMWF026]
MHEQNPATRRARRLRNAATPGEPPRDAPDAQPLGPALSLDPALPLGPALSTSGDLSAVREPRDAMAPAVREDAGASNGTSSADDAAPDPAAPVVIGALAWV